MERKARLESGFASMRPIVSLSLFYVLFLSMESLLGERAAAFLPPDAVAFAGSVAAAASLVGFLLYALVRMRVPGVCVADSRLGHAVCRGPAGNISGAGRPDALGQRPCDHVLRGICRSRCP